MRATLMKQAIRTSMRFIPNHGSAYRFCSWLGHQILPCTPRGFHRKQFHIEGIPAEWLTPDNPTKQRTLLYLHGGGYMLGSLNTHRLLAARIGRAAGVRVLMIEYRLAPKHPFPAALEDALTAYRWLLKTGVKPDRIAIAGDSAGGGLTVSLLQAIRDQGLPAPACGACLSPWLDLTCSLSSVATNRHRDPLMTPERIKLFARFYSDMHSRSHPGVSPFFGEVEGLPPMLLQVGGDEILLPECSHFARKANDRGCRVDLQVWPGMFHVWQFVPNVVPEGRKAIQHMGDYLRQAMA